ncbi:polysaccharide pyruvyl transferase family protein, partial [Candidatus Pacearchaeota archaeon]|nr:polysaccharide pyruvyl transferase family protein [Candidatus Pacearchaeota archaeon]
MRKLKNIIISGTNFWNPGDDFVRDGVIRVLKELFEGYTLNFLFYNFNADYFPQSKFKGIGNMIAAGDLDKYRGFVDAIVIAGLSAGDEIKDLYNWIVANRLEDRVYLIGAGYENDYVDKHIYEEPEATIFKNARVIIGRTEKTPAFIPRLGLPYYHLNCPAILSVKEVKDVPADKKIEKIGFSIQIPHDRGIPNQSTGDSMYQLATSILLELSSRYAVEVVAHHKTEYFYFLNLLKDHDIPVVFSSFYQDLFDIYPRYDLVISTRLHACLFANGFGIPAFIINETDRHTHTADGFSHSRCINNINGFNEEFEKINSRNLQQIAREART